MICRLLQAQSAACVECGAATMVSLERGADGLKFGNLSLTSSPTTRKDKIANAAGAIGIVAGYGGIIAGAALWWPAIPIILGLGVGGIGVAMWKSRDVDIAPVDLWPIATATEAVEQRGIAHRLTDSVKSAVDGKSVLVEECVVRRRGGVLVRRTTAVPFVIDVEGERLVVTGTVRISAPYNWHEVESETVAALGVPENLPIRGVIEHARVREGDRVRVTGLPSKEIVRELAFHRDAGEATAMRGVANAVVAIAVAPEGHAVTIEGSPS
jgi:hypothetical protein